jgi:hypothetical protein
MSLQVGVKMDAHGADGYYGKRDLKADATDMLDGRGVTKIEKKVFFDRFDKMVADKGVKVTDTAIEAAEALKRRMRGYSSTKKVHAPTLDKAEIKDILSMYVDRSRSYGGGE